MLKNQQKEVLNDFLLVFLLFIFVIVELCLSLDLSNPWASGFENLLIFLLLATGICYGYISNNAIKSYLIGFLLWPIFLLFNLIQDYSRFEGVIPLITAYMDTIVAVFLISIIWGLPGFFISQRNSVGKRKWIYVIASILSLLIIVIVNVFLWLD